MPEPTQAQIEAALNAFMGAEPDLHKAIAAALTAAAGVEELLPSTNFKDGKPYNYCPECGRDDRFLDKATIERCTQVAENCLGALSAGRDIAAAIRALKDEPCPQPKHR
jgi:hypothetical protein